MKNLVTIQEAKAVTSSLQIAEVFSKEHRHVLDSIRNLVTDNSAAKSYFFESHYENRGKWYPMFIINRDGFTLLAMGFTGKKALQFKIDYIKAFNKMEDFINNQKKPTTISLPTLPQRKATGKRVETYLPNEDVLRLQIASYKDGYNSIYHLLQTLVYDYLNKAPYTISLQEHQEKLALEHESWQHIFKSERESWQHLLDKERSRWKSIFQDLINLR